MHHWRTGGLDIPCQVASPQSLTPFLQANSAYHQKHQDCKPHWTPELCLKKSFGSRESILRTQKPDEPEFILNELRGHLLGKFQYSDQEADEAIALFRSQFVTVSAKPLDQAICRDPDDDQILATAVAADADCIVTGDKDLLVLQNYDGIEILSPSDFVDFESRQPGEPT